MTTRHVSFPALAVVLAIASSLTAIASPIQASDPGVDVCFVIKKVVNLREEPSLESRVIRKLSEGEMLVLLSRFSRADWYNVIHVTSGDEGWIHNSAIEIQLTSKPARPSPFSARDTGTYENPSVVVTNDSHRDLTLVVGTRRYSIPANSARTYSFPPGSYEYRASAPGVVPAMGTQEWEVGHEYTWRFWIVTTRR